MISKDKELSEARREKALRAEHGEIPKFHKGKHGKRYDYYTCGNCGCTIDVNYDYCFNCGYRIIWDNPRCMTGRMK